MKNFSYLKSRIVKWTASAMTGMFLGFTVLGAAFAASPQISEAEMRENSCTDIWENVATDVTETDMEILSRYMNGNILAEVSCKEYSAEGILREYCALDTGFYEIVVDYFN